MVRSPGQTVDDDDQGNALLVLPSALAKPLGMTMAIWAVAMLEHASSPSRMVVLCMGSPKWKRGPYWTARDRQARGNLVAWHRDGCPDCADDAGRRITSGCCRIHALLRNPPATVATALPRPRPQCN